MNQRTILRTILAIVLLCGTAYGVMATWDDTKGTGDALTAAEWNAMVTYLNGIAPGSGDMLKSTYDADADNVVDDADKVDGCDAGSVSGTIWKIPTHLTGDVFIGAGGSTIGRLATGTDGYQLTTHGAGTTPTWELAGSGGTGDMLKSTYDPNTDGVIAAAQGGTGVTDDTYDADMVDGCDAGSVSGTIWKIPTHLTGDVFIGAGGSTIGRLATGTDGYQLTTHGAGTTPTWEPAGSGGTGDMLKSTYDADADNVVDDADKVDGCDAGSVSGTIWKIPTHLTGDVFIGAGGSTIGRLATGTDGYQLTTHGAGTTPTWEPAGSGDMLKSTYDTDADNVVDSAEAVPWAGVTSKPSTFTPSDHSTDTLTSGTLPVGRGGTGVTDDTYDADKVDGCDAGYTADTVWKIGSESMSPAVGDVFFRSSAGQYALHPCTDGYQLTTHGASNNPTWAAAGDLIFSDTHCPKCGKKFEDGDNLILHVIGHNEVGDILTIPMHLSCAEAPKKAVTVKRKVMEDRLIFDETTGETRVQRVPKMQTKTVTKYRLKEGYSVDSMTGNFERHNASIPEPTPKTFLTTLKELVIKPKAVEDTESVTKSEAVEGYEAESREIVYEDYEFVI